MRAIWPNSSGMMDVEVDAARGLARISLYHEQSSNTMDGSLFNSREWRGCGDSCVQTDGVLDDARLMQQESLKLIKEW